VPAVVSVAIVVNAGAVLAIVWVEVGVGTVDCWLAEVDVVAAVGAGATVDVLVRGAGPVFESQFTGPADDMFVVLMTHDRETVTRTASTGRFCAATGLEATAINPRAAIAGA
jgi:hypothetical protein